MAKTTKDGAKKSAYAKIASDSEGWTIMYGKLKRKRGRPAGGKSLFGVVAEKIPFTMLSDVEKHMVEKKFPAEGVYLAHDSMGCPRYIGRGNIFNRLKAHRKDHELELKYFSFYQIREKKHERELETVLIRAAGPLLEFNDRKKGENINPGKIGDFEAGTRFYERQRTKGKKRSKPRQSKNDLTQRQRNEGTQAGENSSP